MLIVTEVEPLHAIFLILHLTIFMNKLLKIKIPIYYYCKHMS